MLSNYVAFTSVDAILELAICIVQVLMISLIRNPISQIFLKVMPIYLYLVIHLIFLRWYRWSNFKIGMHEAHNIL